jgi:photosynthetic reaction center cytochrome c subunit
MVGRSLSLLALGSLLAVSTAFAQNPQANRGAPAQRRPIPPPTNLKVLPKDSTGQQVVTIMRGIAGDLGVECTYCHAKNSETGRPDFASDANPMKDRARVMLKMANAINTEYLTQLTDPKPDNPVTCGTCHRGMAQPQVFVPPQRERHAAPPAAPATPQSSN